MARTSLGAMLLLFTCSLYSNLHCSLSVFRRKSDATQFLRIHKRANQFLEEIRSGDLERECIEEKCSFEEAKEIFKSQEKTMEFWFDYKDLTPCKANTCKNGGVCKVKHYIHSCTCPPRFGGSHCEIEKVHCWYKNGGCWQYCQDTEQSLRVICSCALGYILNEDGKGCTPSETDCLGVVEGFQGRNHWVAVSFLGYMVMFQKHTPSHASGTWPYSPENSQQPRLHRFPCGLMKKSTRSLEDGSTEYDPTNIWDTTGLNETMVEEHLGSGNQTSGQAFSVNFNQTTVQGRTEEEDMEEIWGNFTEGDVQSWLNFNSTDAEDTPRIVGGSFCRPGDCPWQVLIQNKRGYGFCGGSLIGSQWVLTAAHCLDIVNPHQVTVGDFDKYQREQDEQKVKVRQFWKHPQYDSTNYNNDIALIRLTSDVVFTQHVFPICLPSSNLASLLIEEQSQGMVSGWGATHAKGRLTRFLMKVKLPLVSMDTCRQSTEKPITDNMFCAGYAEEGRDACEGDSGGPFAAAYRNTWYLLGIVSWGEGCADVGKYGVYTRVSNYIPWIKEVIESETDSTGFLRSVK